MEKMGDGRWGMDGWGGRKFLENERERGLPGVYFLEGYANDDDYEEATCVLEVEGNTLWEFFSLKKVERWLLPQHYQFCTHERGYHECEAWWSRQRSSTLLILYTRS